ncbi:MAG: lipopolysaccharide assembly protein LapA domain-containing protein [Proteobacteria bacterium]|nr:lipopolysaccharide assembly protein LapA domain-containing protein [Pseudomonadota bacterium]
MNRLRWLITVPVAIIVVVFAVNNRGDANVNLWPLDLIITWPLFAFVFIGIGVGFALGAILMWFSDAPVRRRAREQARNIRDLERAAKNAAENAQRGVGPAPVALPSARTD